jgi:cytochrome c biogenesis protein ResB
MMVSRIKILILSRVVVIAEILTVIVAGIIADLVPQRFLSSADLVSQWRIHHAGLVPLVDILQLHAVYTSIWFVSVIALAGMSLAVSSVDQIRMARSRFKTTITSGQELVIIDDLSPALAAHIAGTGYKPHIFGQKSVIKFIRCSWGYWGIPLFHLGMVVVMVASLYIALTERRGALVIAQRETLAPSDQWSNTEEGLLAEKLRLPAIFRFDALKITYDRQSIPERIESLVTFINGDGTQEQRRVAINGVNSYQGIRIYHANEYGDAFSLEFMAPDGSLHVEKLLIGHPLGLNDAGYLDTNLPWLPVTLSLKYFADVEHRSMNSTHPQLIMRLMAGKQETARAALLVNQRAKLGDYQVRLLAVDKWAKFTFVDVHGMAVVFTGFGLMMLGALLSYMLPPRELCVVRREDDRYAVHWRATKFAEFYAEERTALLSILQSAG